MSNPQSTNHVVYRSPSPYQDETEIPRGCEGCQCCGGWRYTEEEVDEIVQEEREKRWSLIRQMDNIKKSEKNLRDKNKTLEQTVLELRALVAKLVST